MKQYLKVVAIAVAVVLFLVYVYPTPYRYYNLNGNLIIKENIITGKMYRLNPASGWIEIE